LKQAAGPHPGEVLREWLADISVTDAARRAGITRVALSRVRNGSAGISADMDLRLSKARHDARLLARDASQLRHVTSQTALSSQSAGYRHAVEGIRPG
jgi:addiction module HigA family antidote